MTFITRSTFAPRSRTSRVPSYATAHAGPAIVPNLSVNSFLPEAVIISRSLARVMPT